MDFIKSKENNIIKVIYNELAMLKIEFTKDVFLHLLIFMFVFIYSLFAYFNGYENKLGFFRYWYVLQFIIPFSIVMYSIYYFFKLLIDRELRPLKCFYNRLTLIWIYRTKLMASFLLLTSMSMFMSSFSFMKSMIPIVNMFKYDLLFHELDSWLFLGQTPAILFHELFVNPYIMFVINVCYNLWFFMMWGVLCYFLLKSHSSIRTQFFVSWLLCWSILGNLLAMLLSSAGPVFLSRLSPTNDTYVLVMQILEKKHEWLVEQGWPGLYSLAIQDRLWEAFVQSKDILGSGISAMPSMHVSIAVLLALSVASVNRKVGSALWIYAVIIFVGSFTLGWHYFVDGLVSAPLTFAIWHLSGYITNKLAFYSLPREHKGLLEHH